MIVADAMVILAMITPHVDSAYAERWFAFDPDWIAPPLWRSELRNILATAMRRDGVSLDDAIAALHKAERSLRLRTLRVRSSDVLRLSRGSGCTAYDCEYVALAESRAVRLVTADRQVLRAFPNLTIALEATPG